MITLLLYNIIAKMTTMDAIYFAKNKIKNSKSREDLAKTTKNVDKNDFF